MINASGVLVSVEQGNYIHNGKLCFSLLVIAYLVIVIFQCTSTQELAVLQTCKDCRCPGGGEYM